MCHGQGMGMGGGQGMGMGGGQGRCTLDGSSAGECQRIIGGALSRQGRVSVGQGVPQGITASFGSA